MKTFNAMVRMAALCILLGLAGSIGAQQSYPVKPIRLIVPYPPGGPTDLIARAVSEQLAKRLGQPVIVDSRGGAATIIGAEIAARSAADGYTLLIATVTTLAANPALNSKLPYDPEQDFAPVSMLGGQPYLLVIHPAVPAKSVAHLVAHAKANPGQLTFASAGVGSGAHLAGEMFKHLASMDIVHVPYKGSGQAMSDLMGNQVTMMFGGISALYPHVQAGRLRALAVSSARRSITVPDLPTLAEAGVEGYQTSSWNSLVVPRGTPAQIIQRLNKEVVAVLNQPEVLQRLKQQGIEPDPGTPAELASHIKNEIMRFQKLIKAIGLKLES